MIKSSNLHSVIYRMILLCLLTLCSAHLFAIDAASTPAKCIFDIDFVINGDENDLSSYTLPYLPVDEPDALEIIRAPITGPSVVCTGSKISLTDTLKGGIWSSSDTAIASINLHTGILTGICTGAVIITYTALGSDVATYAITVNPSPSPFIGTSYICDVTSSGTLSTNEADGTWSSSNTSVVTVGIPCISEGSSFDNITGVSAGTATISFISSAGCATCIVVTVAATIPPIKGPNAVSEWSFIILSDVASSFGTSSTWSSSNTSVAYVSGFGEVFGNSKGSALITYTTSSGCSTTKNVIVQTPIVQCSLCLIFGDWLASALGM